MSVVQWSQKHRRPGGGRLPRRCTDRVEDGAAWMLMAVWLFVLALSVLAGVGAGAEAAERGRAAEHERAQVEAVVLTVAAVPDGEPDADSRVTVQYADRAGRIREDVLWTTVPPSAGSTVQVWVDRAGALAPAPPGALDPVVIGALVGLGAAGTGGLLLALAWLGVRGVLDRRNSAAWAREWKKVESEWTGRRF